MPKRRVSQYGVPERSIQESVISRGRNVVKLVGSGSKAFGYSAYRFTRSKGNVVAFARSNWNLRGLIMTCFFFSGLASLIYQMLWVRQLGLVFGTTLQSVSTVLSVFMAGLALGSFLFGRLADRTNNPLRMFAFLEVGIGAYVMFIPLIFKELTAIQVAVMQSLPDGHIGVTLVRILLCFVVLIVPTTFMGGTLPVIAKYFVRKEGEVGSGLGNLYFINTLGAVFGTFLAGFFLVQYIGVLATTFLAASIDVGIGVGFFFLQKHLATAAWEAPLVKEEAVVSPLQKMSEKQLKREESKEGKLEREHHQAPVYSQAMRGTVLIGFSFAGMASLSLEVSWTRVLSLVLGSSVYAFSLMLTAFLLGIALGSSIAARFIDRRKNLWFYFFLVEALIGISIIILNPLLGRLPLLFVDIFSGLMANFWALQTVQFLLSFLIMLVPTIMMGAAFPIAAKIYTQNIEHLGGSVGRLYAGNTFGSMVGPLLTGFVIIPLTSIQWSISLVASIYLMIAGVVFIVGIRLPWHKLVSGLRTVNPRRMSKSLTLAALATITIISFLLPAWASWDRTILTSGVYLYKGGATRSAHMLFYEEGLLAIVSVEDLANGERYLRIDGKSDASSYGDLGTELMLGHLPMLLHPDPKKGLVVGLGSGITLGAMEQYSSLESIEAVEIEGAVIEAASYFSEANHDALNYPKLKMVEADARNYVLASTEQYDVITAEPSNPWIAGSSMLFTKEQFELYNSRLSDDGIICQWIHYYSMDPSDLKIVFNTFRSVFPHATLWGTDLDLLLIGSKSELSIDFQHLETRLLEEDVQADLKRVDIEDPYGMLGLFIMGEDALAEYSAGAPLHTDDRPVLQYSAPKSLYSEHSIQQNIESMADYVESVFPLLTEVNDADAESKIQNYMDFNSHIRQMMIFLEQNRSGEALSEYEAALETGLNSSLQSWKLGMHYWAKGELDQAVDLFKQAIATNPTLAPCYVILGNIYIQWQQYEDALDAYNTALELVTTNAFLYLRRGYAHQNLPVPGSEQAIADYNTAIKLYPGYADAYVYRGWYYIEKGDLTQAMSDLNRAIQLDPGLADAYLLRGRSYFNQNDYDKSIADYSRAIKLSPTVSMYMDIGVASSSAWHSLQNTGDYSWAEEYYYQALSAFTSAIALKGDYAVAYLYRGQLLRDIGYRDSAIDDFEKVIELDPDTEIAEQAQAFIDELQR
ncbi:fused MFS/spermidine synthase [Chloroflexota bacterium]